MLCFFVSLRLAHSNNYLNGMLVWWLWINRMNWCCCGPLLRARSGAIIRRGTPKASASCADPDGTRICSCCYLTVALSSGFFLGFVALNWAWAMQTACDRDCQFTGCE